MKKALLISTLLVGLTPILLAQCIPGGGQSKMKANAIEKIDVVFNFDYKINSTIEYKQKGKVKRMALTYYVNTQDGSMFFPKGMLTANNFEAQRDYLRFDGTVWLANRQLVNYMFDKKNNQKRAMTVHKSPSAKDEVFINQHAAILSFFNDRNEPGVEQLTPEPLPSSFKWSKITHGFAGYIYDEDEKALWTLYLDENPTPSYKTSTSKVGFLAGIINFLDVNKCNALIVFSKIEQKNGDYIQEELLSITPEKKSFDGTTYQPFGLLEGITGPQGYNAQSMKTIMAEFQDRMMVVSKKVQQLHEEKAQCKKTAKGDPSSCNKKYDPLIKKAEEDVEKLKNEFIKKMGAEDLIKE